MLFVHFPYTKSELKGHLAFSFFAFYDHIVMINSVLAGQTTLLDQNISQRLGIDKNLTQC